MGDEQVIDRVQLGVEVRLPLSGECHRPPEAVQSSEAGVVLVVAEVEGDGLAQVAGSLHRQHGEQCEEADADAGRQREPQPPSPALRRGRLDRRPREPVYGRRDVGPGSGSLPPRTRSLEVGHNCYLQLSRSGIAKGIWVNV